MWKYNPFRQSYDVKCPDGSTKTVYKDVNVAFPLFINGWKGNFSSEVKAKELGDAAVKAEYATKIDGLLYALDELNQGLMMTFRAVYITYSTDPCGNALFFQREVSKLLDEQRRLRALKLQIDSLITMVKTQPNNLEKLTHIFSDLVHRIGIYPSQEVTIAEMRKAEQDAKALSGDNK